MYLIKKLFGYLCISAENMFNSNLFESEIILATDDMNNIFPNLWHILAKGIRTKMC